MLSQHYRFPDTATRNPPQLPYAFAQGITRNATLGMFFTGRLVLAPAIPFVPPRSEFGNMGTKSYFSMPSCEGHLPYVGGSYHDGYGTMYKLHLSYGALLTTVCRRVREANVVSMRL